MLLVPRRPTVPEMAGGADKLSCKAHPRLTNVKQIGSRSDSDRIPICLTFVFWAGLAKTRLHAVKGGPGTSKLGAVS